MFPKQSINEQTSSAPQRHPQAPKPIHKSSNTPNGIKEHSELQKPKIYNKTINTISVYTASDTCEAADYADLPRTVLLIYML